MPASLSATEQTLGRLQKKYASLLRPASTFYGWLMRQRVRLYEHARPFMPQAPCISIGNIALGGTGKTPLADWFLNWAQKEGKRAALLTRGYKSRPPFYPFSITPASDVRAAGDEPLMLAMQHPDSLIIVDPKRRRAAAWAQHHCAPDLFILDDGFQHLGVHRDVNIVLMRPEEFGPLWNLPLPAGRWREGASALDRATVILVRADEKSFTAHIPLIRSRLQKPAPPVFSFSLQPAGTLLYSPGAPRPVVQESPIAKNQPYLLVSGVGTPHEVELTAEKFMGLPPARHLAYPDHFSFSPQDAAFLSQTAKDGNLPILVTAKDAQKLALVATFPFYVLLAKISFGPLSLQCDSPDAPLNLHTGSFETWWTMMARRLWKTPTHGYKTPSLPHGMEEVKHTTNP